MSQPLLSVCIPAFNGAIHIGEAIRSVLGQTFEDFELVVVDDASSDGTPDVVERVRDPRVRFVPNPLRLGLVDNWNHCLELARGRYVTVFHQDDVMAPDNLELKLRFLEAHPTAGLVHSNVAQIDADGALLSRSWAAPPSPRDEGLHDGMAYFQWLVTGNNIVCAPSVVMRREAFERLGGFDRRLPFTADWEMWLRLALFYDVGYLARPLVRYRRHDARETETFSWSRQLEQAYLAKMLAIEKHPDRVPDVEDLRWRIAQEYRDRALVQMRRELREGRPVPAGEYLAVALSVCARVRDGRRADVDEVAVRDIFEALRGDDAIEDAMRQAATRAEHAETRAEELARALGDRDRTIDAMMRTRAWRAGEGWWALKRALNELLRRR